MGLTTPISPRVLESFLPTLAKSSFDQARTPNWLSDPSAAPGRWRNTTGPRNTADGIAAPGRPAPGTAAPVGRPGVTDVTDVTCCPAVPFARARRRTKSSWSTTGGAEMPRRPPATELKPCDDFSVLTLR